MGGLATGGGAAALEEKPRPGGRGRASHVKIWETVFWTEEIARTKALRQD